MSRYDALQLLKTRKQSGIRICETGFICVSDSK